MNKLFENENTEAIDILNDKLTEMTDSVVPDESAMANLIADVDKALSSVGMRLDYTDIEALFDDWEEPSEYDAINILFPLQTTDNDQTEYNLSLTYAIADSETGYMVDIEIQYSWESEDEIETSYVELDD